jgi:hypothetical protein
MTIAKSIQEARTQVEELVERFARNLAAYRRTDYKEEQVRVEFINPFFEALGWDVRNTKGYAEPYKDVIHEDAIRLGRSLGEHRRGPRPASPTTGSCISARSTLPADRSMPWSISCTG